MESEEPKDFQTMPVEPPEGSLWMAVFDFIKAAAFMGALVLALRLFVVQPYIVQGKSMEPTFKDSEYIVVDKLTYRLRDPHRGEVVILNPDLNMPDLSYIKRVIGLPGERIVIENGKVKIYSAEFPKGWEVDEKYLNSGTKTTIQNSEDRRMDVTLGPDEYFVMGDNRANSLDSRTIGPMSKSHIVGKAKFIVLPVANAGSVPEVKY